MYESMKMHKIYFQCNFCDKSFRSEKSKEKHETEHIKDEPPLELSSIENPGITFVDVESDLPGPASQVISDSLDVPV